MKLLIFFMNRKYAVSLISVCYSMFCCIQIVQRQTVDLSVMPPPLLSEDERKIKFVNSNGGLCCQFHFPSHSVSNWNMLWCCGVYCYFNTKCFPCQRVNYSSVLLVVHIAMVMNDNQIPTGCQINADSAYHKMTSTQLERNSSFLHLILLSN